MFAVIHKVFFLRFAIYPQSNKMETRKIRCFETDGDFGPQRQFFSDKRTAFSEIYFGTIL